MHLLLDLCKPDLLIELRQCCLEIRYRLDIRRRTEHVHHAHDQTVGSELGRFSARDERRVHVLRLRLRTVLWRSVWRLWRGRRDGRLARGEGAEDGGARGDGLIGELVVLTQLVILGLAQVVRRGSRAAQLVPDADDRLHF